MINNDKDLVIESTIILIEMSYFYNLFHPLTFNVKLLSIMTKMRLRVIF